MCPRITAQDSRPSRLDSTGAPWLSWWELEVRCRVGRCPGQSLGMFRCRSASVRRLSGRANEKAAADRRGDGDVLLAYHAAPASSRASSRAHAASSEQGPLLRGKQLALQALVPNLPRRCCFAQRALVITQQKYHNIKKKYTSGVDFTQ